MFYRWDKNEKSGDKTLHLFLKIQPNSSKDEFTEILDERIKVRITAPPVDGKANKHLIKFLAKVFKVPKGNISIKNGETSRNKHLLILNPQQLPAQISRLRI
jgi:hypothetical protein